MEVTLTTALTVAALWLGYRITRAMVRHRNEPESGDAAEWVEGSGHASGYWVRRD